MLWVSLRIPEVQKRILGLKNTATNTANGNKLGNHLRKLLYSAVNPMMLKKLSKTMWIPKLLKLIKFINAFNRIAFLLSFMKLKEDLLSQ